MNGLVAASRRLCASVDSLRFPEPVAYVYNPLAYARALHERYIRRFGTGRKHVLILGMNPGPWGMTQTGVPFGEIAAVREWMGIDGRVDAPAVQHPKRPVLGFACARSEVSGRRLWGLMREQFSSAERFFSDHFVVNYCPLMFMDADARNITPDKLRASESSPLFAACDDHLRAVIAAQEPAWLVGVGVFAEARLRGVADGRPVVGILHPSPANPKANRDWAGNVKATLHRAGVW